MYTMDRRREFTIRIEVDGKAIPLTKVALSIRWEDIREAMEPIEEVSYSGAIALSAVGISYDTHRIAYNNNKTRDAREGIGKSIASDITAYLINKLFASNDTFDGYKKERT